MWPPPPTHRPSAALPAACLLFISVERLARTIALLLVCFVVLSVGVVSIPAVSRYEFEQSVCSTQILQAFLLFVTGLCFLVWTYRLHRNLRALGAGCLRFTPMWAVGYFFIPVFSFYRPYQIFREIWQASDPGIAPRTGQRWKAISPPAFLGFWWVALIVSAVMNGIAAGYPNDHGAGSAAAVFSLASALLTLLVVRSFTKRQERTVRLLTLLH